MTWVTIVKDVNFPNCTCVGSHNWLEHWELFKNIECMFCRACSQKATLKGVHVLEAETNDLIQYIVPLCNSCSKNDSMFTVWSSNELVPAICPPSA